VITMYHALEHVEDPSAILAKLRGWMTDGGVLLVEVPNVEADCISPRHRFHFAHFYNFNRVTLEALGRKAGFEPVNTSMSSNGGNLISVFRPVAGPEMPRFDSANYERVAAVIKSHTTVKYYCSASPYAGPLSRLRTFLIDWRAARRWETPTQMLDGLIAARSTYIP
jgi:hypothetical protein